MSKRAQAQKGKGKQAAAPVKDTLAKAAAEVLQNGISTVKQAVQALSGGKQMGALDTSDTAADVATTEAHERPDQALPVADLAAVTPQHFQSTHSPTQIDTGGSADARFGSALFNLSPLPPDNPDVSPPRQPDIPKPPLFTDPQPPGGSSPLPLEDEPYPTDDAFAHTSEHPHDGAAAAVPRTAAATTTAIAMALRTRFQQLLLNLRLAAAHPQAAPIGAAIGLVLMLIWVASAHSNAVTHGSLGRQLAEQQRGLAAEVAARDAQLGDLWRQVAAVQTKAAQGEADQAAAVQAAAAQLTAEVGSLRKALEAQRVQLINQAAEIGSVRHVLRSQNAVPVLTVESGADDAGGAQAVGSPEVVGTTGPLVGGNVATAEVTPEGEPAATPAGLEAPRLPPCHLMRTVAEAGPVVPSVVSGHSGLYGKKNSFVHVLHATLHHVFSEHTTSGNSVGITDPRVRIVTDPAVEAKCLELLVQPGATTTNAAAGIGGSPVYGSIDLTPLTPANLSAISFRYPSYGTWDTQSAIRLLSATLYEAPATVTAANAADAATASSPPPHLFERHVELPELAPKECQHLSLPPSPPGSRDMLVHRVRLHVLRNNGKSSYSCVPRVLLHGYGPTDEAA